MTLFNLCRNQVALRYKNAWKDLFVLSQTRTVIDGRIIMSYVQTSTFSTDSSEGTSKRPNFAKKKGLSPLEKAKLSELSGWKRRLEEDKMTKFGPWRPEKRVARSTMEQMRMLNQQFPDKYDIKALSAQFNISFEAVRRILHSKFVPTPEVAERQEKKRAEQRKQYVDGIMDKRRQEARETNEGHDSNEAFDYDRARR
ncbi:hypothetical protein BDF22DRAFT_690750 [Syncephalis plumigaleata]|nr:hypothetical protein BDF22DRAFT_690750 [Syncephalis plumigaleata]